MSQWISFEEIRRKVPLRAVLDHYRIELRQAGSSLRGKCPLPTHGSDSSKASFTATLSKGTGGIWACQSRSCVAARGGKAGGNALDLVAVMEACSIKDAAAKMAAWFNIPTDGNGATPTTDRPGNKSERVAKDKEEELIPEQNKVLTFELSNINHAHPYLGKRGVEEATARRFGIGHFSGRGSMSGRIVFPIHNAHGELVGYAGRSIDETEPRYKFPPGFHKSLELFNLHRAIAEENSRKRVVVVEGFFDCVRVTAAGFPCVALMGSVMSEAQEELIARHFTVVCILLDNDDAGERASIDCLNRLGRRMWTWSPKLPKGKQPDMLSVEDLRTLLKK